jgi:hypothetical protein
MTMKRIYVSYSGQYRYIKNHFCGAAPIAAYCMLRVQKLYEQTYTCMEEQTTAFGLILISDP